MKFIAVICLISSALVSQDIKMKDSRRIYIDNLHVGTVVIDSLPLEVSVDISQKPQSIDCWSRYRTFQGKDGKPAKRWLKTGLIIALANGRKEVPLEFTPPVKALDAQKACQQVAAELRVQLKNLSR